MSDLNVIWQAEKEELERAKTIQERLYKTKRELEQARMQGDFTTAGQLQHGTIPQLEQEMQDLDNVNNIDQTRKSHKTLAEYVSADAIATCVAHHTGIPVSKITGSESKKHLDMEKKLREEVRGLIVLYSVLLNTLSTK